MSADTVMQEVLAFIARLARDADGQRHHIEIRSVAGDPDRKHARRYIVDVWERS